MEKIECGISGRLTRGFINRGSLRIFLGKKNFNRSVDSKGLGEKACGGPSHGEGRCRNFEAFASQESDLGDRETFETIREAADTAIPLPVGCESVTEMEER